MIVRLSARKHDSLVNVEVLSGDIIKRFAVRDVHQVAETISKADFVEVFDAEGEQIMVSRPGDVSLDHIERVLEVSHANTVGTEE